MYNVTQSIGKLHWHDEKDLKRQLFLIFKSVGSNNISYYRGIYVAQIKLLLDNKIGHRVR